MSEKLKPCPFCRAEAEVSDDGFVRDYGHYSIIVEHDEKCPMFGLDYIGVFDTAKEAVEAWNRRADNGEIH